MNRFHLFASLSLLTVILAACVSGTSTVSPAQPIEPSVAAPGATLDTSVQPTAEPTELSLESTPLPVATSRGPDLHATDPSSVSLASGELQLVEFFRFT